ncbi:branched-chain amino acid ABC transporter substrate-binding protein [Bacillus massiliigorillae]|uniref:branched-chain amino acid ABC transporter substrate-binding protein n=1 Tax=Bacillus massiliigorillae TaxID=1243664 RepID=UPI00039F9225|nr:branched-chain amino acid ABC transporter substrate-binding protein [Bacillus massiliigorillae]
MKWKKAFSFLLSSSLAIGLMAGCSSTSTSKEEDKDSGSGSNVIKIATQSPLSGGSANIGEAIKLGAQLKLEEEKAKFEKLGYKLQLQPYDDQGDPKKGVSNANLIGADKEVYGVVGHFNSGVAIPSSEVYEKYKIPMVSPANTAVEVTERGLKTVNRICGRDDFQGPAGAEYAITKLGAKKIFIIQDKTAYGSGLADAFKKAAEDQGATIVGYEGITIGEKDFNGVINQVLSKKPDLLYFGGLYAEGGLIIKQAREKGIDVPIMGGDGMDSSGLVDIAGEAVKNTFITSVAGDSSKTETAQQFVKTYESKFKKKPESFSIYGYDSMGALLAGIEKSIADNGGKIPEKEKVAEAVRSISDYKGALTEVSFNDKGDNEHAKIYLYKFDKVSYPAVFEGEVSRK